MQHWDRIEAFIAVVRTGRFSSAALALKVSVSHVSRLVAGLEQQLGTQLLYRTTRTLLLTDAGRIYFERCQPLISELEEATHAVQSLAESPHGLLRVTAATNYGERFIAPLVNDFMTLHPQLEVDFHLTNRRINLLEEGVDLAIRLGTLEDSSLMARRIASRQEYVVASPDYLAREGAPQTLDALRHHHCLAGSRRSWVFQEDGRRREVRIDGRWRANSGLALLDAARKGLGLAQLPDYYVMDDLHRGTLVSVLKGYRHPDTGVWAVYPGHQHTSPKIRHFIDFLVDTLPAPPPDHKVPGSDKH